ncbi:MAG: hypothetical protein KDE47_14310, partial [Caldilineaceae bacterium]|nr:hypothetical protein [Caldilineaceae bacterium]
MKLISTPRSLPFLPLTLTFTLLLMLFHHQLAGAAPAFTQGSDGSQAESGFVYIQFQSDVSRAVAEQTLGQMNAVLVDWLAPLHIAKVQMGAETGKASFQTLWALAANEPSIQFVEPGATVMGNPLNNDGLNNDPYDETNDEPNDETDDEEVGYNDPSLKVADESYGLTQVHALEAWDI